MKWLFFDWLIEWLLPEPDDPHQWAYDAHQQFEENRGYEAQVERKARDAKHARLRQCIAERRVERGAERYREALQAAQSARDEQYRQNMRDWEEEAKAKHAAQAEVQQAMQNYDAVVGFTEADITNPGRIMTFYGNAITNDRVVAIHRLTYFNPFTL